MKHRSIALAMALALSLSMMTACGSKEQPSQSDASTPDASISTPAVSTPDISIPDASTPDVSTPEETPAAPEQSEPEMEEVADLSLNKTDFTLFKAGDSYQLQAIQTHADGKKLLWSSNNEQVATVSEDGTVTAVAPGVATITVSEVSTSSVYLSASCTVRCKFEADAPASGSVSTPEQKPEVKPEQAPEQTPEQKPEEKPEQKPEESKPAAPSVDLSAFYNRIITSVSEENRPFMVEYDAEMANAWYPGLADVELKQRVMHQAGMTAVPVELVFVECANSADVSTVKNIFQTRVNNMVNDHFNYPFVVETWTNEAKVLTKGNYVALIVMPADSGMMDAAAAFNALF